MIEEMTGPGGWGVLEQITVRGGARPVVVSHIGCGDNALFREGLTAAGWQYVVAVKGSPLAHPAGAVAQARSYGGRGQPPKPVYPEPPVSLRQLALASAGSGAKQVISLVLPSTSAWASTASACWSAAASRCRACPSLLTYIGGAMWT